MKQQDGNGSSEEIPDIAGVKDPQEKTQDTVPTKKKKTYEPHKATNLEVQEREDGLENFTNSQDYPVDMNADDAERLFKQYMAKLTWGLRT